jgi:hypothetical protein
MIAFALAAGTVRAPAVLAIRDAPDHVLRWAVEAVIGPNPDKAREPGREGARKQVQEALKRILHRLVEGPLRGGLGSAALATVDVARLLVGGQLLDFPYEGHEFQDYMQGFLRVGDLPGVERLRADITRAYLRLLVGHPPELSHGARLFLQNLPPDEVLADYVADPFVTAKLLGYQLGQDFWRPLAAIRPVLERTVAVPLLEEAVTHTLTMLPEPIRRSLVTDGKTKQRGLSSTPLALAIYDALKVGLAEEEILRVINTPQVAGKGLADTQADLDLDDVLREVQNLLHHVPIAATAGLPGKAEDILFTLEDLICGGALGGPYGTHFRKALIKRLKAESGARGSRYWELRRWSSWLPWRRPAAARQASRRVALAQRTHAAQVAFQYQASGQSAGPLAQRTTGPGAALSPSDQTVPVDGGGQQTQPSQTSSDKSKRRHRKNGRDGAQNDTTVTGKPRAGK